MDQDISTKRIRITSCGRIKSWVTFSLEFLLNEASDCRRVILDTLPASVDNSIPSSAKTTPRTNASARLSPSTSTVSQLISVVEIIKREYLKVLETKHSTRLHGLHQYNEIGTLEDLGIVVAPSTTDAKDPESARSQNIIEAVSGKHFIRHQETPFMRITLSTNELPELIEKGATYQPPSRRKLTKSARARMRKRAKTLQKSQIVDRTGLAPAQDTH